MKFRFVRPAQSSKRSTTENIEVVPIAITKEGKWLPPAAAAESCCPAAQSARLVNRPHCYDQDRRHSHPRRSFASGSHLSLQTDGRDVSTRTLDVVFPVLHGPYGEDGTLQGLLEMADIPYVGCGVVASACGMDKVAMKMLFAQAGLPICKYVWFLRSQWQNDQPRCMRRIAREIGFPCFVKPANLGSSVGISKATDNAFVDRGGDFGCAIRPQSDC